MEPEHGPEGCVQIPYIDFHVAWIPAIAEHSSWDRAFVCDALEAVRQKVSDLGIIEAAIQVSYAGAVQGAIILQRSPRRAGRLQGPQNINATLMVMD